MYALGLITDPSAAFLVSPFPDTQPEEILTSARILNGDEDAVFNADMPRKLHCTALPSFETPLCSDILVLTTEC